MILPLLNCICFFYSIKIEGENIIYEQKKTIRRTEKLKKFQKNITLTHIFNSYIFQRLFLTSYTIHTLGYNKCNYLPNLTAKSKKSTHQ